MSDRIALEGRLQAGRDAERLLQDPLIVRALEARRTDLYNRWLGTAPGESALREEIWFEQHGLDQMVGELTKVISDATLAVSTMKRDNYTRKLG